MRGTMAEDGSDDRGRAESEPVAAADVPRDGSWKRMLEARPVRNVAADVKPEGQQGVRITVKKRKPFFLIQPLSWIIRPRLTGTVLLDRLGSQVWDLCADDRTVEQIVDEFARRHRLTFHESRVAVTNYMKLLVERGALAMVQRRTGRRGEAATRGSRL
ncbi:MAG: PqqD family protein [Planctomycetota bacterium]